MLKEQFLGRNPSHFQINPFVKAYIISESLVWTAWNFFTPIFAIFIVNGIHNSNVQTVSSAFSVYLISRVIFELVSGKILVRSTDRKKYFMTIIGTLFISISYIGFAFIHSISALFFFYAVAGMGLGLATPAKNALFSVHLDKNKESTEWSIADASTFICMALAAALGGFIVESYGFQILFIIATVVNLLGVLPYLIFLDEK